ncbi:hypothetical protein TRFO_24328 [Tritrichomonas foetus]|uniref:Leucine Rich Repeat family protein n=1 Tax=Tritrichomonas foetus TaxID=1144522 RepID=A0A1J4K7S8_9EUKA|nr:hypothetical protein TRFO_24328 [Tritrichomonas foetus]|eukprot:OHT07439.1 hypothetical protein TRFO_24328 [Tritrichomonas foetus]
MQSIDYIYIDDAKLEQMRTHCWCEFEQPLLAAPVEFKLSTTNSFSSGFLMITRGSNYLFKSKIFGGIEFLQEFHLLNVNVLHCSIGQMIFDMNNGTIITLKTDDVSQITYTILNVFKTATYGLAADVQSIRVDSTIQFTDVNINERPERLMKWRAIFLAHYYAIKGEQLYTVDYFNKWEGKQTPVMLIGPSLHPGNFANAFGHAIAWETQLNTVVFQRFAPTRFGGLFDSLVENAQTILRIAFTDYENSERLLLFSGCRISRSSIKKYNFLRVISSVVLNFFEKSGGLPQIENLELHKIKIEAPEFTQLCRFAEQNEAMKKTVKYFELSRTTITNFPTKDLSSMIGSFSKLESISLRGLNGDGLRFLNAIIRSKAPIRAIHLNYLNFRSSFEKVQLPETLLQLDLSQSNFSEEAFTSFISSMTRVQAKIPFIVQLININGGRKGDIAKLLNALPKIDIGTCQPVISEFDFSNNFIPAESSRQLFAFLFTQKQYLRHLALNCISTDDHVLLLKNVMTLITSLQLPAIDLCGNPTSGHYSGFEPVTLAQFVQALAAQNVRFLRRISLSNSRIGANGLTALSQLVEASSSLNEISADGAFLPPVQANAANSTPSNNASSSTPNHSVNDGSNQNPNDEFDLLFNSPSSNSATNYFTGTNSSGNHVVEGEAANTEALIKLWAAVSRKASIITSDSPDKDMQVLGLITGKLSQDGQAAIRAAHTRQRPTTAGKRTAYCINTFANGNTPTFGGDIFAESSRAGLDGGDNDFATHEQDRDNVPLATEE